MFLGLPLTTTFNEFLTRVVMSVGAYRYIEFCVAPQVTWMAAAILKVAFGLGVGATGSWLAVEAGGRSVLVLIIWNCIGWQSLILYAFTLVTGLRGSFTTASKLLCVIIGFEGTLLLNILRIVAVILFAVLFGQVAAIIFHDYVGTVIVLLWLVVFWKIANEYLLATGPEQGDSSPSALTS